MIAIFQLLLITFVQVVTATDFYKSLSIVPQGSGSQPTDPWTATFEFEIPSGSVRPGQHYIITLDWIYRIKFNGDEVVLPVITGGTTIGQCTAIQGANLAHSVLDCFTLPAIEGIVTVVGTIAITVFFAVGGSTSSHEIAAANHFTAGANTVSWADLSTTVNFDTPSNMAVPYNFGHTTGNGLLENYYLFPGCDNNTSSGSIVVDYSIVDDSSEIDCSTINAYYSNDFNDFWFPKSYSDNSLFVSCENNRVELFPNNIPAGSRIWLTVFQPYGSSSEEINNKIQYELECGTQTFQTKLDAHGFITMREAVATGLPLTVTSTPWTGTTTSVSTTIDSENPTGGTIIVFTPTTTSPTSSEFESSSSQIASSTTGQESSSCEVSESSSSSDGEARSSSEPECSCSEIETSSSSISQSLPSEIETSSSSEPQSSSKTVSLSSSSFESESSSTIVSSSSSTIVSSSSSTIVSSSSSEAVSLPSSSELSHTSSAGPSLLSESTPSSSESSSSFGLPSTTTTQTLSWPQTYTTTDSEGITVTTTVCPHCENTPTSTFTSISPESPVPVPEEPLYTDGTSTPSNSDTSVEDIETTLMTRKSVETPVTTPLTTTKPATQSSKSEVTTVPTVITKPTESVSTTPDTTTPLPTQPAETEAIATPDKSDISAYTPAISTSVLTSSPIISTFEGAGYMMQITNFPSYLMMLLFLL